MTRRCAVVFAVLTMTVAALPLAAENPWIDVTEKTTDALPGERLIVPDRFRAVRLDREALAVVLGRAPAEGALYGDEVILSLPMPDGRDQRFAILESPIMEPALAFRYPEISTYLGRGLDDRSASARLDWTPAGFHAMVLSASGTVFIDPDRRGDTEHYISYRKRDHRRAEGSGDFRCLVSDATASATGRRALTKTAANLQSGTELRTYRAAVAATAEYTSFHGGTVVAGLAAIVTAMNRVTGIYERDVAVRMTLVANNDLIVYTDSVTDPYTNFDGVAMLSENQTNLDLVIGSANYDIGHVFSTGGGGIASLGVPCVGGAKARGVTGLSSPVGDTFYVDYVAHEMGHQFGANHTFNSSTLSCGGGNRNKDTAYEPGSGSTIMAYAGICGADDLQNHSDDYFHGISLDEIVSYTTSGTGDVCPVHTATGNTPPTVDAGDDYTVPISTPIDLGGSAVDGDGDALTYCWEEFDLGPSGTPDAPSKDAPIFRSFDPVSTPYRSLPKLDDLLTNTHTIGELLPTYARTLTFRLTARDNRSGGGAINSDTAVLTVTDLAGPFAVTEPNTAVVWNGAGPHTVTWDVAGTDAAPVSCAAVDILLSVDGGTVFATTLQSAVANVGSAAVTVSASDTTTARIKVRCSDNVFFDVSNADFTITNAGAEGIFSDGFESGDTVAWSGAVP